MSSVAKDADNNELPSADQLDALLEEASALAEDLSLEIAGDDPFLGIADVDHDDDESEDDAGIPSVDAQLDTVDELISDTQSTMGAEVAANTEVQASVDDIPDFMSELAAPEPSDSDSAAPDESAPDASVEDIPDFMQEFTQPEVGESGGGVPQPDEPSASIDDVPDFMAELAMSDGEQAVPQDASSAVAVGDSPKLGRVGTSYEGSVPKPTSEPETIPAAGAITSRIPKWLPIHLIRRIPVAQIRDVLSAQAVKLAEKGVDLLEVADRPTQRIGFKPRQLIGLIAISTLGTALVVFVISMF